MLDLLQHPQTGLAWTLSLWVGAASTALAACSVAVLLGRATLQRAFEATSRQWPAFLATPHLALAIALALWLAPSGWAVRLISPTLTGWTEVPEGLFPHDPWGLSLILGLWLKETPFLAWLAWAHGRREDVRRRHQDSLRLGASLGRSPQVTWAVALWPEYVRILRWPLLAVWVYGCGVVDMALVLGPTRPPTLGVLAWQWLQDVDPAEQARGRAAGWLLAASAATVAAAVGGWSAAARSLVALSGHAARWLLQVTQAGAPNLPLWPGHTWLWRYVLLWWALVMGSVIGVWLFPALWPQRWTLQAWQSLVGQSTWWLNTVSLAAASATLTLIFSLLWIARVPPRARRWLQPALWLTVALPPPLWVGLVHALALKFALTGQWHGVLLGHLLAVMPYVLLCVEPAWTSTVPRWRATVAALGQSPRRGLWQVTLPLLRPALCTAWAVGFAVSVAQSLPTALLGGGLVPTLSTEALALSAGGQRSTLSALALAQMLLPLLVFGLAAWGGRPRRFTHTERT